MDNFSLENNQIDLAQDNFNVPTHNTPNPNDSEQNYELSPRFKRYEERMKKNPLEFVGYKNFKPKTIALPDGTIQEIPEMSNEVKKVLLFPFSLINLTCHILYLPSVSMKLLFEAT
jgi:hypothetical protein